MARERGQLREGRPHVLGFGLNLVRDHHTGAGGGGLPGGERTGRSGQEAEVSLTARGRLEGFLGSKITADSPKARAIADAAARERTSSWVDFLASGKKPDNPIAARAAEVTLAQAIADAAAVKETQRIGLRSNFEYREATDVFERQLIGPYIDEAATISQDNDPRIIREKAAAQVERDLDDFFTNQEKTRRQTPSEA